jgi:hypothetical protein
MRGYDNPRFNHELLLDLQLCEGTGTVTQDWSKAHHAGATLAGAPTWQSLGNDLTYLDFDASNPDTVTILAAASNDLDFTSGDFSGAAWIAPDLASNRHIFWKGAAGLATGWAFSVDLYGAVPDLEFLTGQTGPVVQATYGAIGIDISGVWQFAAFTRSGASARIYLNGRDVTASPDTHIDPTSAAAADFIIGTNALAGGIYDGDLWRPRVWGRCLAAAEMLAIYEAERDLFGV